MLLAELHGYKKYREMSGQQIADYLEKNGVSVKNGAYGVVLVPEGKDYVYRLWTRDGGYEEYLRFIGSHKGSKHFPKFKGPVKKLPMVFKHKPASQDFFHVVKMEKLHELKGGALELIKKVEYYLYRKQNINDVDTFIQNLRSNPKLDDADRKLLDESRDFWELLFELVNFYKHNTKGGLDFSWTNVLTRSNGDWVITDPAFSTLKAIDLAPEIIYSMESNLEDRRATS